LPDNSGLRISLVPKIIVSRPNCNFKKYFSRINKDEKKYNREEFGIDIINVKLKQFDGPGLYLKIDPWTQLKTIENIWSKIEKMQQAIFGYRTKVKPNFGRDLCWYDLNKKEYYGKLSSGRIAALWKKYFSQNISRNTIKGAIQRIQKYVDRLGA